jgi:hypothetical protein
VAGFGKFHLDPTTLVAGTVLPIPLAIGRATLSLNVPNDARLVGLRFWVQAGLGDPRIAAWHFSNLLSAFVVR